MKKLNNVEIRELLSKITNMFQEKTAELSKLDSLVGDGDHGVSMARGVTEAKFAIDNCDDDTTIEKLFQVYANGLIQGIGGAVGPLFGTIFYAFATAASNEEWFDAKSYREGIRKSTEQVMQFGGAKPGDKTMVDAMVAATNAIDDADDLELLAKKVMDGAHQGMVDTIEMQARKGRSKYRKEQSLGFQDAGATSYYYLVREIYSYISEVRVDD